MGNNNNQSHQGKNEFVENMKEAMPEALMRAIVEFLRIMFERGIAVGACAANFGISEHEAAKFVDKAKKKK